VRLPDHLTEEVKLDRRDRIMAAQQEIAFAFNRGLAGRELDILIDGPAPGATVRDLWVGRSYADAPDVDGVTYVRGSGLEPGDLVSCTIVGAEGYDTVATAQGGPPRRRRARPKPRKRPASPLEILG
jgi:ribosomal protein S12 methylthiotransferase